MMNNNKKKFIPNDWLQDKNTPIPTPKSPTNPTLPTSPTDIEAEDDVEYVINQIESTNTDLTSSYEDWRNIGFAIADKYGTSGRDYFQRISRFHKDYNFDECNKQYDACLSSSGNGITIKTLFHLAKEHSLSIAPPRSASLSQEVEEPTIPENNKMFNTPSIPQAIYDVLPEILKESCTLFDLGVERDVFLLGALAVLSACLPNVKGYYFNEAISAHLYAFITAPAGSGKGKLKWAKNFASKIHRTMVDQSKLEKLNYDKELENYNSLNKKERQDVDKPQEPKHKMFFIPANSSSSAFIQAMSDNDFKGLIFETEADTLANTLKQEWGNFSDILRKAFHHESTNMFRRKDNEYIEIEDPHLAIALSGTPKQVHNMMPDTENGLFSRFLYYAFEDYSDFKNPFDCPNNIDYQSYFDDKSEIIFQLYTSLLELDKPITFSLNKEQQQKFTTFFGITYKRNRTLLGNNFNGNSRRLGIINFRLAMTLSALRILEDGDLSPSLLCNEVDFDTAINLSFILEKHAIAVFNQLPNNKLQGIKLKFYNALPCFFDRQGYLKAASTLDINPKTAEKYIKLFINDKLLNHDFNKYTKPQLITTK